MYFPSNNSLDHKCPISLFMDRSEYFSSSLTWKFDGDSKSDIEVYLKWLSEPQKFVIMIRCKIIFDIIRYYVIFAVTLYLSMFVWSSDFLSFTFMNVVVFSMARSIYTLDTGLYQIFVSLLKVVLTVCGWSLWNQLFSRQLLSKFCRQNCHVPYLVKIIHSTTDGHLAFWSYLRCLWVDLVVLYSFAT